MDKEKDVTNLPEDRDESRLVVEQLSLEKTVSTDHAKDELNVVTSVGRDWSGLTTEERHELAKETSDKIQGRNIDEILELDLATINRALGIINDDRVKSNNLKVILNDLLKMITSLVDINKELYNYKSMSYLTDVWGTSEVHSIDNDGGYAGKIKKVQDHITKNYSDLLNDAGNDTAKAETTREIIKEFVTKENIILDGCRNIQESSELIIKSILGFDILEDEMNQPDNIPFEEFTEEIRVDDFNDIRLVKGGKEIKSNLSFASPEHALLFAQKLVRMASNAGKFDRKNPFVRLRIGATTRVSIMRDPIATRDQKLATGPVVHMVIRRQRTDPFTTDFLIEKGSISEYGDKLLETILGNGISVCVYGGTGTGKTAMFNAYATKIASDDRTFTLAEVDEMKLRKLDTRKYIRDPKENKDIPNPNYNKAFNSVLMWEATDLETPILGKLKGFQGMFNAALTMTPSTIIIQESKGGEVADLVEAAISDHQVATTVHCADAKDLPYRLLMMYQQSGTKMSESSILKQVISAFPVVVGCKRYKDGSRKMASIVEYRGISRTTGRIITNTMMYYKIDRNYMENGKLKIEGKHLALSLPSPTLRDKMQNNGMLDSQWQELDRIFKQVRVADKPAGIDDDEDVA